MIIETIALFTLFLITGDSTPLYYFTPVFAFFGAGFGLSLPQLTNTVLASVPFQKAGVAAAANNTIRQISAAFGVAVLGAVMVSQISTVGQADLAVTNLPLAIKASLSSLLNSGLTGGSAPVLPPGVNPVTVGAVHGIITDAITQGARWATFTAGIFVALGALSSVLIPSPRPVTKQEAKVPTIAIPRSFRATQITIVGQFLFTIILLSGLSSEYSANEFMRDWLSQNAWPIGSLLDNYIAPILGIAIGLTGLVAWTFQKRRNGAKKAIEELVAS
jgi:hypothetical protein